VTLEKVILKFFSQNRQLMNHLSARGQTYPLLVQAKMTRLADPVDEASRETLIVKARDGGAT